MRTPKDRSVTHKCLVPGMDALISLPELLRPEENTPQKAEYLVLPVAYIGRLRRLSGENNNRSEGAQKALSYVRHILGEIHYSGTEEYTCSNGMKVVFADGSVDDDDISLATVETAESYANNTEKDLAIYTGDNGLAALAYHHNLDVAKVNPNVYTGRRKLKLPLELYTSWHNTGYITIETFKEYFPNEPELCLNEFIEWEVDPDADAKKVFWNYIGRVRIINDEACIQQLQHLGRLPYWLKPQTVGQAMYLEALLAPVSEIPIVIAPSCFGTGKTFLAIAVAALDTFIQPKHAIYDRIFIVPRDGELGKEIGFLPGSEMEKTLAKARPITDNLLQVLKLINNRDKNGQEKPISVLRKELDNYLKDYFEFVSLINMGGRSISDSFIIYDEAQDMERFQMDQLLKRIGDGSKMVIIGDPNQVFNRHLSANSNGLSFAATKLAGNPYACVVSMTEAEITRSTAAIAIAEALAK